jgi:hypothetical protein
MYFLPYEDVKVTWTSDEQARTLEGHAWYDGEYCRFELDHSCDDWSDPNPCQVYALYALSGETLAKELAREKLVEMGAERTGFVGADPKDQAERERGHAEDERFIGRFIGPPIKFGERGADRRTRYGQAKARLMAIPRGLRKAVARANFLSRRRGKEVA